MTVTALMKKEARKEKAGLETLQAALVAELDTLKVREEPDE